MSSVFPLALALLGIIAAFIWAVRAARAALKKRRAIERARETAALQKLIESLYQEISVLPSPPLATEGIPKRFPSRQAAQTFGERWSRGGPASFRTRDVDTAGHDENHPQFNRAELGGGVLYPMPALFFGMTDPHGDDEGWYLDFLRAKKSWMENYRTQLKEGVQPF